MNNSIVEMIDTLIELLQRCSYWAAFVAPLLERAKGWLAHVNGDFNAASYHLNRSLLEAMKLGSSYEEQKYAHCVRPNDVVSL